MHSAPTLLGGGDVGGDRDIEDVVSGGRVATVEVARVESVFDILGFSSDARIVHARRILPQQFVFGVLGGAQLGMAWNHRPRALGNCRTRRQRTKRTTGNTTDCRALRDVTGEAL